jgi:L-ascorbate metabolism protein UlaG (beta-lactamase superfamily)
MGITITFLGHSGFVLEGASQSVAIDPFLTGNPVATMRPEDVRCSAVVLTHGHADHFGDTISIAKANDATVFAAYEICEYCQQQGVAKVEPMNPGGKVKAPFGFVALTPAIHSSSYEGRYMGMPCGAVVKIDGVTVYHCGDTALFGDMKLIGEMYQPDIAFVPIGDRFTMGPEHATRAAELIKPKIAVPIHYGTWPLLVSDASEFKPSGVDVKVMEPSKRWVYE